MSINRLDIILETKELSHALSFANSVVEKRNVIAELSNIKLSANGINLELTATDMDLYLKQNINAQILNQGETTVSTHILTEIIRKIPDKEIKLKVSLDGLQLNIASKNCEFNLLTLPAEQFPNIEDITTKSLLKVNCKDFVRIIDYTQFSMSLEETRYNLNGIYLHVIDNFLFSASTDGHRLSLASIELTDNFETFGVIIPRKTVQEILKITKDPKNSQFDIEIVLGTNKIKFICNNIVLFSKLIDGTFPDYLQFIPKESSNKLVANTKLLAAAIDRVATITVDKFRAIKLAITSKNIVISASGEAKGEAIEQLQYSDQLDSFCSYKGEELVIGFNPKYITDVLGAIKDNQVEFYFDSPNSPVLIKVSKESKDNFIIMPVKV